MCTNMRVTKLYAYKFYTVHKDKYIILVNSKINFFLNILAHQMMLKASGDVVINNARGTSGFFV